MLNGPAVDITAGLAEAGDHPALLAEGSTLTYAALDAHVEATAAALGSSRRLVLVEAGTEVGAVVAYLAALRAGCPVLLTAGGSPAQTAALLRAYDPDVVLAPVPGAPAPAVVERRRGSAHDLHPDLALLLSTSGSTGSPKLVRLSAENLVSNAEAIATYLEFGPDDRAQTTLPLQYCYGLSVLNSHLARRATVVLSTASVVDPCFWTTFRRAGTTGIAGVPHTFELLDRIGFDELDLPTLRTVTQAGGRLASEAVQRYASLGERRGWRFVVMYGQTEATARMAYLPPHLARHRPTAIGVAIPGGALRVDPVDGEADGVGELVYTGPNVMLGYASAPADLALGRTVHELRTGDLGRRAADGLFEVVGRRSRFVKPFGVRVDLQQLERLLEEEGRPATCAGDDRTVVVAVRRDHDVGPARQVVTRRLGLPPSAVRVLAVAEPPRLANGKLDHAGLLALAALHADAGATEATDAVHRTVAELLGVAVVSDDDTFVSLGGDSLSYVEASIRLEALLGPLPVGWHQRPLGELRRLPRARRRTASLDTTIVLRALAILAVVAGHADVVDVRGGAHLLLAVSGYNLARFQLSGLAAGTRSLWRSIGRVAAPSAAWIALVVAATDELRPASILLATNVVGAPSGQGLWRYWYIEVLVQLVAVVGLLLLVPRVRAAEQRHPWALACGVLGAGLLLAFGPMPVPAGTHAAFQSPYVLWLFALGWAAARCPGVAGRLALTAVTAVAVPAFFGHGGRELVVAVGIAVVLWLPTLPVPRWSAWVLRWAAAASLWTYLTHWQVLRLLDGVVPPVAAVAAAFVTGAAAAKAWDRLRLVATSPRRIGEGVGRPAPQPVGS